MSEQNPYPPFDEPIGNRGWICDESAGSPTYCKCIQIDGAGGGIYSSESICNEHCCPPPKTPGYNCKNTHSVDITRKYICVYTADGARYTTKQECEFRCDRQSGDGHFDARHDGPWTGGYRHQGPWTGGYRHQGPWTGGPTTPTIPQPWYPRRPTVAPTRRIPTAPTVPRQYPTTPGYPTTPSYPTTPGYPTTPSYPTPPAYPTAP